jgi:hypothetical protein
MRATGIALIAILLAFFAMSMVIAVDIAGSQLEQTSWQPVPCVVETSRVEASESVTRRRGRTVGSTYYLIAVAYRYEIDGVAYTGRTYSQDNHWRDRADAEEVLRAIPPGTRTTCWFDPDARWSSVLRVEIDYEPIVYMGALALAFLAVIAFIAFKLVARRRATAARSP